jgi:transcriptional regulator with XRE-family HTH domain
MENKAGKRARDAKAIGVRLRLMRKALELTQEEFVKPVGMTQGAYAQYEGGHRRPSVLLANAIVDAYHGRTGVSLDWIYRGDTDALQMQFVEKVYPRKVD